MTLKKINNFRFSKASEQELATVKQELVDVARLALTLSEVDFKVTEGLRNEKRQKKLVASGKSWTLKSKHLTGEAIDIAAMPNSRNISWEWHYYEEIARAFKQAAETLNIKIIWGGDWKQRDGVHFELA